MHMRKIDIASLQEPKQRGEKTKELEERYKPLYSNMDGTSNGLKIMVGRDSKDKIVNK